ncbi:MAG TPA: NUDIX hydrolase, partial [Candidatus Saccharimonadales bacterium]|nr:NUDIX hydrolase [Candidatus Saccharimonadales bacterium]
MIDQVALQHHIQKHIVTVLMYKKEARFSELRPAKIDTNLFTYHLKVLLKEGVIIKYDKTYTLSSTGLAYVDRVSTETTSIRRQPKIITMLLVQNSEGQLLLQQRTKQPYIDAWTLPYGKLHIEDHSIREAAEREVYEKLNLARQNLRHAGDCYIRVVTQGEILSTTLAHVFRFETDETMPQNTLWVEPLDLPKHHL